MKPLTIILAVAGSVTLTVAVFFPGVLGSDSKSIDFTVPVAPQCSSPSSPMPLQSSLTGTVVRVTGPDENSTITIATTIPSVTFTICQQTTNIVTLTMPASTSGPFSDQFGVYFFRAWEDGNTSAVRSYSVQPGWGLTSPRLVATYSPAPVPSRWQPKTPTIPNPSYSLPRINVNFQQILVGVLGVGLLVAAGKSEFTEGS